MNTDLEQKGTKEAKAKENECLNLLQAIWDESPQVPKGTIAVVGGVVFEAQADGNFI